MEKLSAIEIIAFARRRSIQGGNTKGVVLSHDEVTVISAALLGIDIEESPEVVETDKTTFQGPEGTEPGFAYSDESQDGTGVAGEPNS